MNYNYEALLQEATEMFACGHDNKYIEFQFAEKGVPDDLIDQVVAAVKLLRKQARKQTGMKQLLYGASICAVAILVTFLSFAGSSPIGYVLWGAAITGLLVMLKGVANIMNL